MRYAEIINEGSSKVLDIEGVRYYKNPSREQVLALAAKMDLRGTSDGENVYVWDANVMIHHNARYWLRHDGYFYDTKTYPNGNTHEFPREGVVMRTNFYVTNRKVRARPGTKEGWASAKSGNIFYQLDPATRISVYPRGIEMESIPAFKTLVRNAARSDQAPPPPAAQP